MSQSSPVQIERENGGFDGISSSNSSRLEISIYAPTVEGSIIVLSAHPFQSSHSSNSLPSFSTINYTSFLCSPPCRIANAEVYRNANECLDVDIDPVSLYSMPFPLIINGPFTPCSDNFSGPFFFKEEMVTLWNSHFQVCFDPPTKP